MSSLALNLVNTVHFALPDNLMRTREQSATFFGVSPNTFDAMVADGKVPKPRHLHGRRIGWDVRDLMTAASRLAVVGAEPTDDEDGSWDDLDEAGEEATAY